MIKSVLTLAAGTAMTEPIYDAAYYLEQAEFARQDADRTTNAVRRLEYLRLAESWQRLANNIEAEMLREGREKTH